MPHHDPHPNREAAATPQVKKLGPVQAVPVFQVHVYVQKHDAGVSARSGNLPELSVQADSQRQALAALIAEIKRRLTAQSGKPPDWLDPPDAVRPGEQVLLLAVHL